MGLDPAKKKGKATGGKLKNCKAAAAPKKGIFFGGAAPVGKAAKAATPAPAAAAAVAFQTQPSLHPELLDPSAAATPEAAEAIRREKARQEEKLAAQQLLAAGMAKAAAAKTRPKSLEEDQSHVMRETRHIKHENKSQEKMFLPKVGRFDVVWPAAAGATPEERHKARMAAFRVNFPAIKPNKHLPEDVRSLIPLPGAAAAAVLAAVGVGALGGAGGLGVPGAAAAAPPKRYQVGWVLVECPNTAHENNDFPVYLRLPAFVSQKVRSLAKLPLSDEASPWKTSVDPRKLDELKQAALSRFGPNREADAAANLEATAAANGAAAGAAAAAAAAASGAGADAAGRFAGSLPPVADAKTGPGSPAKAAAAPPAAAAAAAAAKRGSPKSAVKGSPANSTTSNTSKRSAAARPRPPSRSSRRPSGRVSSGDKSDVVASKAPEVAVVPEAAKAPEVTSVAAISTPDATPAPSSDEFV
jgi:hypothetical protein